MEKKKCHLCVDVARVYCESDEASLCWDCDGKVHGANFLAARHTRCLLCSACQSLTPWNASGPRLGPTLSNCESCLARMKINSPESSSIANDQSGSYNEEEEEAENLVGSSSSVNSSRDPVAKRTRRVIDLNRSYEEGDDNSNDIGPLKLKVTKLRQVQSAMVGSSLRLYTHGQKSSRAFSR